MAAPGQKTGLGSLGVVEAGGATRKLRKDTRPSTPSPTERSDSGMELCAACCQHRYKSREARARKCLFPLQSLPAPKIQETAQQQRHAKPESGEGPPRHPESVAVSRRHKAPGLALPLEHTHMSCVHPAWLRGLDHVS